MTHPSLLPLSDDGLCPEHLPAGVRAVCTTRIGGVSAAPFDSFNLGDHVGDDPAAVAQNR
ncbi:MAG: laccase domain-containing protein, partial [Hydrogenophaga sp.]|nr:laccase domain-containing protein [Hydrogenophaga sp.]